MYNCDKVLYIDLVILKEGRDMEINKIKKRSQIIASIFVVVVAVFCVYLVQCSTSFAGLNVKTDELRKSTVDKLLRQTVMQGSKESLGRNWYTMRKQKKKSIKII